jgi:hypothetical protein
MCDAITTPRIAAVIVEVSMLVACGGLLRARALEDCHRNAQPDSTMRHAATRARPVLVSSEMAPPTLPIMVLTLARHRDARCHSWFEGRLEIDHRELGHELDLTVHEGMTGFENLREGTRPWFRGGCDGGDSDHWACEISGCYMDQDGPSCRTILVQVRRIDGSPRLDTIECD